MPLLALLKHPLVGGEGDERLALARRGPRARPRSCAARARPAGPRRARRAFRRACRRMAAGPRRGSCRSTGCFGAPHALGRLRRRAWRRRRRRWPAMRRGAGPTGGWPPSCSASCRRSGAGARLTVAADDAVPLLRATARRSARCGRPTAGIRASSSGACSKRGCSAPTWSSSAGSTKASGRHCRRPIRGFRPRSAPTSGMPSLEFRIGLAAHDFASALGAPRRADHPRPARQPLADRRLALLLRLDAMTRRPAARHQARAAGRGARRSRAAAAGRPPSAGAAGGAAARADLGDRGRPAQGRSVRLLRPGDPRPAARSIRSMPITRAALEGQRGAQGARALAASRTSAIRTSCAPRAEQLLERRGDPPDAPRLVAAAADRGDRLDRRARAQQPGGRPQAPARPRSAGEAVIAGVTVHGRADRIDRLADGGLAIVDYKTGQPPTQKAVDAGLRAPARAARADRRAPAGSRASRAIRRRFEYWSLARHKGTVRAS